MVCVHNTLFPWEQTDTSLDDRPLTQKPIPWLENSSKLACRRLDRNGTFLSLGQRLTDSPAPWRTLRPSRYRNPAHKPSDDAEKKPPPHRTAPNCASQAIHRIGYG